MLYTVYLLFVKKLHFSFNPHKNTISHKLVLFPVYMIKMICRIKKIVLDHLSSK